MRKKRKEFSVLKWIIFPLNSVVLAGIIAYFNITVFGYRDGWTYRRARAGPKSDLS